MTQKLQAIRGMNDLLPPASGTLRELEQLVVGVLRDYGYREIRTPLVEKTELFSRTIGTLTDIVDKEMYTFIDRNGDSLSLRPEGTAGVVRAAIEHGLLHNQVQKLWYGGPMFRHERPQKGRYRQFHQIGAECLGLAGPEIDAEMIAMTARLWTTLGLTGLRLEINSLGDAAARASYRGLLTDYLRGHLDRLDADSRRRLDTNPLRILDSKNPDLRQLVDGAPKLFDHLDAPSEKHFRQLRELLESFGIEYVVNPHLVRGLDYYSRTVFEWITDRLGAQGTVCAGGRYDALVARLGGPDVPAVGLALGIERIFDLFVECKSPADAPEVNGAYFIGMDEASRQVALRLLEQCRADLAGITNVLDLRGGSLGKQLQRADKSGAVLAVLIGGDELLSNNVQIKYLRDERPQETIPQTKLSYRLRDLLLPLPKPD